MQSFRRAIVGGALIAVACSSSTEPQLPAWDPVLRSTIVAQDVTDYGASPPNLLLGTDPEDECADAAILSFDLDPRIYLRTVDGGLRLGGREDLAIGSTVEVWIDPDFGIEDKCPLDLYPLVLMVEESVP